MVARSDWGVGSVHQKGIGHTLSVAQSSVGFHGPRTAAWIVFLNGAHRGEDIRFPVGESKVGSSWTSDVVLTGIGIGSHHATIRMGMGEGSIIPAAANREIRINNQLIHGPSDLPDGVLLSIGDLHGVVRYATQFSPGYRPPEPVRPASMPTQAAPKFMTCGWLVVNRGPLMGQDFRVVNGVNRIGSQPGLEISIADPHLLAEAMTLECSAAKGCILKSVSGERAVKVNGSVCELGKVLRDSDIIAIDHVEMLLKWY